MRSDGSVFAAAWRGGAGRGMARERERGRIVAAGAAACRCARLFSAPPSLPAPVSVSEPASTRHSRAAAPASADKRSLFERLIEFVMPGPDSKAELIRTLADAENRELIEPESRAMLEGVLRMADMTAGDVMVPATRMDLLDIAADYDELLNTVIDDRALALSGLRRRARQHHRHPDGQGPAEAAARARAEPAHAAAAGGLRAREQGAERPAARLPLQPQPPGDRHRRIRQHRRAHHHRGRARGDRRRDRGRVRRAADARTASSRWPTAASAWPATSASTPSTRPSARALPDGRLRHHRRPRRARARPRAAARRGAGARRPALHRDAHARRRGALVPRQPRAAGRRRGRRRRSTPLRRRRPSAAAGCRGGCWRRRSARCRRWPSCTPASGAWLLPLATLAWLVWRLDARGAAPRRAAGLVLRHGLAGGRRLVAVHQHAPLRRPAGAGWRRWPCWRWPPRCRCYLALAGGGLSRAGAAARAVRRAAVRGAVAAGRTGARRDLHRLSVAGRAATRRSTRRWRRWRRGSASTASARCWPALAAALALAARAAAAARWAPGRGGAGRWSRWPPRVGPRRAQRAGGRALRWRCCRPTSRRTRSSRPSTCPRRWPGSAASCAQPRPTWWWRPRPRCRCCPSSSTSSRPATGRRCARTSPSAPAAPRWSACRWATSTRGYTNSVVGLSAGRRQYRYDKHHLVPFGEFIPPRVPLVHRR